LNFFCREEARRKELVFPMVAQKFGPWLAAILLAIAGLWALLGRVM